MDAHLDRFHDHVRRLVGVALARLPWLVDPATGLVVHRADDDPRGWREGRDGLAVAGTSVRYTAMAALGVERASEHGLRCDADLGQLYDALDATLAGVDDSGALGLVLWASARNDPRLAERSLRELGEYGDVARTRRGHMVHTTELAWVVTGLAEALAWGVGDERDVRTRLERAWRRLLEQRGASGLMCFARPLERRRLIGPRALLQGELGFFDAQVYSILACLRFDSICPGTEAREVARVIGEQLLRHQHRRGQWAWHYNARTGGLVDLYPVYAVHQDGMAPMALLPLERATGLPVTAAVARGVAWLFGENEIGEPLVDEERALIWRSLRRRRRGLVLPLKAASLLSRFGGEGLDLGASFAAPAQLEIDREMRPYHLGFCLLAFSEIASAHRPRDVEGGSDPRPTLRTGGISASSRPARASNRA